MMVMLIVIICNWVLCIYSKIFNSLTSTKQAVSFVFPFFCSAHLMYRNFFSLSELPFSISPDPKYLFMSDRHKEALSHLTYGLGEVGGFALLTGEVGTGKTTISRCLMEQLPNNTQAAFILNPTLSSLELLATLCDQLKISYDKKDASLKDLTDEISEKLLENHRNDINTLLIIDEAQHLQPEVLEQLRLLTNLETNTKKLLQVILIGQPELQHLLQRRDLRQLAQRITARYHLMPLTKQELKHYVEHRLQVANCVRVLFDKAALAKVHQLSQGVPRLINLLCHSALMLAYNQNDSVVNKKTVIAAAERALGSDIDSKTGSRNTNTFLVAVTAISLIAFVGLAGFWWGQTQKPSEELVAINLQEHTNNSKEAMKPVLENKSIVQEPVVEVKVIQDESLTIMPINNKTPIGDDRNLITPQNTFHTVLSGDSLYSISVQYNVKMTALRRWNNLVEANELTIGDKLYVVAPQNSVTLHQEPIVANTYKDSDTQFVSANKPKKNTSNGDNSYQVTKVDGVSNDLLARFQAAIDDTEVDNQSIINAQSNLSRTDESPENRLNEASGIKPLTQMSQQLQNAIPALNFEQHIYSSDGEGWVNVNGRDRYEGDTIGGNLIVEKILPQQVILSFQGEKFSLPALTNW
jgi:type II secretory pathway predicted ATPase ExeA